MKRGILILFVLVLVGGALAGGWWWAKNSPQQVIDVLVSGGLEQGSAEEFVDMVAGAGAQVEEEVEDVLVASGSIEGETVSIVSEFGGQIVGLYADEGDEVQAGQVLVELDASLIEAQKAQTAAAVAAAEANVANIKAGTHPAEILAARAGLRQALAQRDAAARIWESTERILANPQEIDAQIVEIENTIELIDGQIELAEIKLAVALEERDQYKAQGSAEEKQLYAAFNYQVEASQASLDATRANRKAAENSLAALQALRRNPLAMTGQVHAAKGGYEIAVAGVAVAIAQVDELEAGALPEEIAAAEALVEQARASSLALDAQIAKMTLHSPIDGVVSSRSAHTGEAALPGAILLTIANLEEVKLTVYVPEAELGRVFLGQEVEVQVDSFPDQVFTGTVTYISQQAEFTPKNVQTEEERVNMVFAVRVSLPNPDHLLKPGMPADAYIR